MASKSFPEHVIRNALLWCDRHCCVCAKQCGVHIETHHIDPKGPADQENCLPVCYDCHGMLSHYDPKQPRGRKFRPGELRDRREQIYERHTRALVPPTKFEVMHHPRDLPCVSFKGMNCGDYPPVKALIRVTPYIDGSEQEVIQKPHYNGTMPVNLNPRQGFVGWFTLPEKAKDYERRLLLVVHVTIIDPYEREHRLLPFGFIHKRDDGNGKPTWYYEPAPERREIIEGQDAAF